MPNAKISQLTAASTPLTGTELVPVVQGGVTKNVSAEDIVKSTIPSGTANGVLYLNASKQVSSGSALTYNGSTLGINFPTSSNYRFYVSRGGTTGEVAAFTDGLAQTLTVDTTASSVLLNSANGGALVFGVSGEQMRLTSTGLGIGTSSPGAKLDVFGQGQFRPIGNTLGASDWFAKGTILEASNYGVGIGLYVENAVGNAYAMTFGTKPNSVTPITERMRLDANGNLGLGVTPSAWGAGTGSRAMDIGGYASFHQDGPTGGAGVVSNGYYNGANWIYKNSTTASRYLVNTGYHQWFVAPSGTAGNTISFTQAMTLDASGNLGLGTTNAAGWRINAYNLDDNLLRLYNSGGAGVRIYMADTLWSAEIEQNAGNLVFKTGGSTERARIDSSGNLLIGQPAIGFANSNSEAIYGGQVVISHVSSASSGAAYAQFGYAGGAIGSITQNGTTAVSYNTSSDYRLKNITGPVTNSGAYIDSLNPVEGTWKADRSTFVGLIAHEVQEVSRTQVATGVKDGEEMQAMDYSSAELIANLIAEVKSLRARVAALEAA